MRAPRLKTRISLALLVAFVLVAGLATLFAKGSFRETELRHAIDDSQTRVDSIGRFADARFLSLGQSAKGAANDAGTQTVDRTLEQLERAGFVTAIVLDPEGTVLGIMGDADANVTLADLLVAAAPPRDYPATMFAFEDGWLLVGSRSTDLQTAVVAAMSTTYLSESFLGDALVHPHYAHAILFHDGRVLAASQNFDALKDEPLRTFGSTSPAGLDAYVEARIPSAELTSRVDEMTLRFMLSMTFAFGLGGAATILLLAYAFRPLDLITDAARRLGRGEEELHLSVRGQDEMGTLAQVLTRSAAALGHARRADADRAQQARVAAEEFELAVGDLSRSVGEADTPAEVAARLADGLLRVTSARAILVRDDTETLAAAARDTDPQTATTLEALHTTMQEGWYSARAPAGAGSVHVHLLCYDGCAFPQAESRKVDILTAQAGIAIHRARAAVEMRRAQAQKETFLDILSHDLKNPLTIARGRVELLARRAPEHAAGLASVEQNLDRAARIIEEAVILSKLERDEDLALELTNICELAEEAAASLRPLAAPRGIQVLTASPSAAVAQANHLLTRAIENLVSNAIKWSPQDGIVLVDVGILGDRAQVRVIDHGPGISDEDKARLFGRFERADRTGVKGTGLGLAIAMRVVKMHAGAIRIEDTPGGGSTFILDIPITAAPRAAIQEARQ